jgi:hypothetical protein
MSETDPAGKPVHVPRPARIKAAVLHIVGGADLEEQTARIDYVGGSIGFALHSAIGVCVATSEHPVLLSEHAFRNRAIRVVHNYDLRLAE